LIENNNIIKIQFCRSRVAGRRVLLAAGQINMRKVDGWQTVASTPSVGQ
jgi:hypothetical protein